MFSPDDLALVKGGPAERRRFLDDTLVALAVKYDALRLELDRIVRQRNTLLKQAGGRLDDEVDDDPRRVGRQARRRRRAVRSRPRRRWSSRLAPMVAEAYEQLAGEADGDRAALRAGRGDGRGLAAALAAAPRRTTCAAACRRSARTATSSALSIGGLPARTHASQGEQRTLASPCGWPPTAGRPSAPDRHRCWCSTTCSSELDADRAAALLGHLPAGPDRHHDGRRRPGDRHAGSHRCAVATVDRERAAERST